MGKNQSGCWKTIKGRKVNTCERMKHLANRIVEHGQIMMRIKDNAIRKQYGLPEKW